MMMDESYVRAYPELERTHFWWLTRQRMVRDLIEAIGRRDLRVLDVGCGSGATLEAIRDLVGDVVGVEIDPLAVPEAAALRGQIRIGTLEEQAYEDGEFDVILLMDVVEHVEDPLPLMREVCRLIAKNGTVVVTVPAFQLLWSSHDDVNNHYRRYRRRDLRDLLATAGFRVIRCEYAFASLFLPKLLLRMFSLDQTHPGGSQGAFGRVIGWIVMLEYEVWRRHGRKFPFGTSVICAAEQHEA